MSVYRVSPCIEGTTNVYRLKYQKLGLSLSYFLKVSMLSSDSATNSKISAICYYVDIIILV